MSTRSQVWFGTPERKLSLESWQTASAALFSDYDGERAGQPSGYVWDVRHADAYFGTSYIE